MKRILILSLLLAVIAFTGCPKNKINGGLDGQDLVNELFTAGLVWNTQTQSLKGTWTEHRDLENTVYGPEGGYIHVIGGWDYQVNFDDETGYIYNGFMQFDLTETINDYAFKSNNNVFTMNGAPYISYVGNFTIAPGGASFGTASSIDIGGAVRLTGPHNFDKTINILISIIINSSGSGGHVSGYVGDEQLDYYF